MACTTFFVSLTQESITTFTPGPLLPELLQRLQAVDSRHQYIQQHQIRLHAFVDAL